MQENSKILRLIYPQWQGGDIAGWFKDMDTKSASQGYILGAQILNLLVDSIKDSKMQLESKSPQNIVTIDISRDFIESRKDTKEGIIDKEILQVQTRRTLEILNAKKPQKILTLGGECSVSIAPFSYLAHIYSGELAVIWLDAHPDIGLPHDTFYQGYHAMAVSALLGKRNKNARFDLQKDFGLPTIIESSKILLAGLNSNEATHFAERVKDFGLSALSAKDVSQDSNKVLSWLKKSGVKKVAIHLDLDVLDAKELYVAVGNTGALSTTQVARLINDVASEYEIVALTIAEHFPKVEIMLRNFLAKLPLIK